MKDLDVRLLAAHARDDTPTLVTLYDEAAQGSVDATARGFYLTHAYVFALELGHTDASRLRAQLIEMGREIPL